MLMISLSKEKKTSLIDKLMSKTQSGEIVWDKIGHHRGSPSSIENYIISHGGIYVFEDSVWTKYNSGFFYLLHFIYKRPSEKDRIKFAEEIPCIHGIYELPKEEDFFTNHEEHYSLVVQATMNTFPESIPPAGDPMNAELKALNKIIKKSMHLNQDFINSFLDN